MRNKKKRCQNQKQNTLPIPISHPKPPTQPSDNSRLNIMCCWDRCHLRHVISRVFVVIMSVVASIAVFVGIGNLVIHKLVTKLASVSVLFGTRNRLRLRCRNRCGRIIR